MANKGRNCLEMYIHHYKLHYAIQEAEASYGQYEDEVHCPPASSWMNEAIKICNRLRKKQWKGLCCCSSSDRPALLEGWRINNKISSFLDIGLIYPPVIRGALINTMWNSCHCPPERPVSLTSTSVAFHFSPSSKGKELPSGGGRGLQDLNFQIETRDEASSLSKLYPVYHINNLPNKMATYNLFYSADGLGTVSTSRLTH